jgi:hypothetical protein
MMIVVFIAVFTVLAITGLFIAVRAQSQPIVSIDDLRARLNPIDLPALMNLIDSDEELYLRENLARRDFNFIRRKRLAATWDYLSRLSANAKLLVQAGQIIQHTSQGEQELEARALVADSVRLRTMVFVAKLSTAMKFVFPGTASPIAEVLTHYSQSRNSLEHAFAERRIHVVART